jgi:hypothetical protein
MNRNAVDVGSKRQWAKIGRSLAGAVVIVGGIVIGQAILYWPSLTGDKVLLPLDILAIPDFYLPPESALSGRIPKVTRSGSGSPS